MTSVLMENTEVVGGAVSTPMFNNPVVIVRIKKTSELLPPHTSVPLVGH
jgi:hypothetical protein